MAKLSMAKLSIAKLSIAKLPYIVRRFDAHPGRVMAVYVKI